MSSYLAHDFEVSGSKQAYLAACGVGIVEEGVDEIG